MSTRKLERSDLDILADQSFSDNHEFDIHHLFTREQM